MASRALVGKLYQRVVRTYVHKCIEKGVTDLVSGGTGTSDAIQCKVQFQVNNEVSTKSAKSVINSVARVWYVIVISQCEYDILVITRVRGGAEDEC